MMKDNLKQIAKKIKKADKICLMVHENPDGDAIGSILAMYHALNNMGKKVDAYIENMPPNLKFLKGYKNLIVYDGIAAKDYDLAIALDCGTLERAKGNALFRKAKLTVNIDHHVSNPGYADINHVDDKAAATGEIVYLLLKRLGIVIEKEIAEALYIAIVSDTGMFRHQNVTKRVFDVAGELTTCGIDTSELTRKFFYESSLDRLKLLSRALDNLELYCRSRVGVIALDKNSKNGLNVSDSDFEGIVDYARNIKGVEVGVFIKPRLAGYRVSLRSNSSFDCNKVASELGGGGHVRAAGIQINGRSLMDVKDIVLKKIEENL